MSFGCRIVPDLRERMAKKQAGLIALAARAGVCKDTVFNARKGKQIRSALADFIEEALEKFEFQHLPRGRKYGDPYRKAVPNGKNT